MEMYNENQLQVSAGYKDFHTNEAKNKQLQNIKPRISKNSNKSNYQSELRALNITVPTVIAGQGGFF